MSEIQAFAKKGKSGGKNSGSTIAGDVGRAALSSVLGPIGGCVMGKVLTFCGLEEGDPNAELVSRLDDISKQLDTLHQDLERISGQLDDVIQELKAIHCQQKKDSWVSLNHSEVNEAINGINDFWRIYTQIADPTMQSSVAFNIQRLMGTAGDGPGVLDIHSGVAHYRGMLNQAIFPEGGTGILELFAEWISCDDFTTVDQLNDRVDALVDYYYNIGLFQLKATILLLEGRMWQHYGGTNLPEDEKKKLPDFFPGLWNEHRQMMLEQEGGFMKAFSVIINRAIARGCLDTLSYYPESEWPKGLNAQWELYVGSNPYQQHAPVSFNYWGGAYAPENRYGHYIIQPEAPFLAEIEDCLSEFYVDSLPTQRRVVIHKIYLSHAAQDAWDESEKLDYTVNVNVRNPGKNILIDKPTQLYATGCVPGIARCVYDFASVDGSQDGDYHMADMGVSKPGYGGAEIAYQAQADVERAVTLDDKNQTGTLWFVPYSVRQIDKEKAKLP